MAIAVGALLLAWPRSDVEAGAGYVASGKATNPPPVMTHAVLSWRPGQASGAVLVVLGLAAVAFLLGRRFGPRSARWGVVGVGVALVVGTLGLLAGAVGVGAGVRSDARRV